MTITVNHTEAGLLALQTAYERGASDDEVAPLWEARRALLVQHHAPRDGASNVNDI